MRSPERRRQKPPVLSLLDNAPHITLACPEHQHRSHPVGCREPPRAVPAPIQKCFRQMRGVRRAFHGNPARTEPGRFFEVSARQSATEQPLPEMFSAAADAEWHRFLNDPGYAEHAGQLVGHVKAKDVGRISWVGASPVPQNDLPSGLKERCAQPSRRPPPPHVSAVQRGSKDVEPRGVEPLTSAMQRRRSTN